MNNAGPSAGLGDPSASPRPSPDGDTRPNMPAASPDDTTTTVSALQSSARARDQLTTKKSEWLDHMLRNLDIVTYCHFSYLYFLDISFIRFLIRAIVQINLFAQKPPNFPAAQRNQKRTAVVSIVGSTIICFLFHVFSDPPSADEVMGGYLHGGMIIDFVGQEGPISRLRLISIDILILLLQLTMLTIKVFKQDLLDSSSPNRTIPSQDLDSEERGVNTTDAEEDITSPISPHHDDNDDEDDEDDAENRPLRRQRRQPNRVNLYSGEIIVADLRIWETVKSQWNAGNTPEQSSSASVAANLANARLRMLFRR